MTSNPGIPRRAPGRRFALIEAVRGLAAILVVYSHTIDKSGWVFEYLFDPGKIGVVVFFFISGYLVIPSAVQDRSAARFLRKRFWRLYPLYWLSLLGALIVMPGALSPAGWIANLTMAQQLIGFDNAIDVYWTLTIEFCLYVIIAACLILRPDFLARNFTRFILLFALACLAVAALRWGLQRKLPTAIPLGLFCMFTGAELRFLREAGRAQGWLIALFLAVIIPACWLSYSFATQFNETPLRYIVSYMAGGAIFLLVLYLPDLDLGRIPRALGDYSFGIYLFHMLVIILLEPYVSRGLPLFTTVLIASIAISAPLYYLVERPAARLGRAPRPALT